MEYAAYDHERYVPSPAEAAEQGRRSLRALRPYLGAGATRASVLEIGCASGSLLLAMREAGFGALKGVDLDPELVRHGRDAFGLDLEVGDWASHVAQSSDAYDLIVALDVLEHLDPSVVQQALIDTRRRLRAGGRLVLRMPNADCPIVNSIFHGDITHRFLATPRLLAHLLRSAGFDSCQLGETLPETGWKRALYGVMHRLVVKPAIQALHFHFGGAIPRIVTRNMYCCATVPT